jgi:hypothetical protein
MSNRRYFGSIRRRESGRADPLPHARRCSGGLAGDLRPPSRCRPSASGTGAAVAGRW